MWVCRDKYADGSGSERVELHEDKPAPVTSGLSLQANVPDGGVTYMPGGYGLILGTVAARLFSPLLEPGACVECQGVTPVLVRRGGLGRLQQHE